jgi:hypothetical protein
LLENYCRLDDPHRAQVILDKLDKLETIDKAVSDDLKTLILDAWMKHQGAAIRSFKKSMENGDFSSAETSKLLEDIVKAAECTHKIVAGMKNPSSRHYDAALKAWADICEAVHRKPLTESDLKRVRGIPQRSQYLLARQGTPTVESFNQMIKAWAYSTEYLRGTMANEVFKKIEFPNGESMRLTLLAWCYSRERKCAMVATMYFTKMMKLLERGREDMELSLDDYHVLFETWTLAR